MQVRHGRIIIPLDAEQLAAPLKRDDVRLQLVVQAWLRQRLGGVHALIEDVPQVLDHFGDDVRAAGRGVRDVHFACGELDDGRGDGGEGPRVGLDEVRRSRGVAECVGGVGDAEV